MILGTPSGPADAVGRFHHLWAFAAVTALLSGVVGSRIPRRARDVDVHSTAKAAAAFARR
jgi:hypothetical protein